ncbi:MAG TPA: adenylyl-sulfate kinase [Acidiferrobacterales bacterium]
MDSHISGGVAVRRIRLDDGLVPPYGGRLVQAFVPADRRAGEIERLAQLPRIELSPTELHDLEMLACGAYSPLGGFMNRDTYASVCERAALPNGLAWGLPVTLAVAEDTARGLVAGSGVALTFRGSPVAALTVEDIYPWEPDREAEAIHGGRDVERPEILERRARKMACLVGGPVSLLATRMAPHLQAKHAWPRETRGMLAMREWQRMTGVHLNNPWQRAQEYVLRCALEAADALLLHSAIDRRVIRGVLNDQVAADASQLLLQYYFPLDRIIVNPLPRHLLNAGTRSALQHAIVCQNYGCERFVIVPELLGSRTPEGDSRDLHDSFKRAVEAGMAIRPVFMDAAFHCVSCGGVATERSCPHDSASRIMLSDSDIHEKLLMGEHLPPMVTRPEVARALSRAVSGQIDPGKVTKTGRHVFPHATEVSQDLRQAVSGHRAAAVWMTGLSGSGKSTIAHRVERELLMSGHRVFVLDGDTLRHGLNQDLGFSDADRRENLRRAGEVVKVMVEAGMIVIASFISPFAAERKLVRDLLGGDFHEVYVEASLADCEARDPKGLYQRARAGLIPQFTGVSSPYEPPESAELTLNTSRHSVDECVQQLLRLLAEAGITRAGKFESRLGPQAGYAAARSARQ